MKITKSQLKQIILEELTRLDEVSEKQPWYKRPFTKGEKGWGKVAGAPEYGEEVKKVIAQIKKQGKGGKTPAGIGFDPEEFEQQGLELPVSDPEDDIQPQRVKTSDVQKKVVELTKRIISGAVTDNERDLFFDMVGLYLHVAEQGNLEAYRKKIVNAITRSGVRALVKKTPTDWSKAKQAELPLGSVKKDWSKAKQAKLPLGIK